MTGRPTKWSPQLQEELANILAAGNYIEAACSVVGISTTTFYRWMQVGEQDSDGRTPFQDFHSVIKKALSRGETNYVNVIKKAAESGTWQAAAWMLERKFPDRWGRQEREPLKDWRNEIVGLLRDGKVSREDVERELGAHLARELFESAGLEVAATGEAEA